MSGVIRGTVSETKTMTGRASALLARDGDSAYAVACRNGFEGTEAEWLESLKGANGTFDALTDEEKESMRGEKGEKGDKGDAFTYSDFTTEQLASLRGDKGDKGDTGNSGVYVGSGAMPSDCNVQIDPNGSFLTISELKRLLSFAPAKVTNVTLLASAWVGSDNLYSQVVSVDGVTNYSKVDLLPSVEQLAIFHNKDVAFVTENENGTVTVYAIGDRPTLDYTMQAQITEVEV